MPQQLLQAVVDAYSVKQLCARCANIPGPACPPLAFSLGLIASKGMLGLRVKTLCTVGESWYCLHLPA